MEDWLAASGPGAQVSYRKRRRLARLLDVARRVCLGLERSHGGVLGRVVHGLRAVLEPGVLLRHVAADG